MAGFFVKIKFMNIFQSIVLAVVQGIAEFLPISSSGHLNLLQYTLGLTPSLTFDIFLNTASFLSVLFFFRQQTKYFFTNLKYILVGSIPAALGGILLKKQFETIFADVKFLPFFFLLTAVYLLITKFISPKNQKLTYSKALIIGFFQAVAILPAVSRSGSTIFAGLLMGLSPLEAFNFSFALFIPASAGALLLDVRHLASASLLTSGNLIAFVVTFMVGIAALKFLQKALITRQLWKFSYYVLLLVIISTILVFR